MDSKVAFTYSSTRLAGALGSISTDKSIEFKSTWRILYIYDIIKQQNIQFPFLTQLEIRRYIGEFPFPLLLFIHFVLFIFACFVSILFCCFAVSLCFFCARQRRNR